MSAIKVALIVKFAIDILVFHDYNFVLNIKKHF